MSRDQDSLLQFEREPEVVLPRPQRAAETEGRSAVPRAAERLAPPHGGQLVDLLAPPAEARALVAASRDWPSWDLTPRQLCDLEMLANGSFSPLRGFLGPADHESVCRTMRLADGTLWPMPITLDVTAEFAAKVAVGGQVALRDAEGRMLAVLTVEAIWTPDRRFEAQSVYGTTDAAHPGVAALLRDDGRSCLGGPVRAVAMPVHHDFRALRATPKELREEFARRGWTRVVAFQTRNPMHRAHVELTRRAAAEHHAGLLIHPAVGMTKPGDVDHFTRVRGYQAVLRRIDRPAALSLLPLAMRMAGPREALWHALIRQNHGCTHFIVGRDHAGPGTSPAGTPWYDPYAAQELVTQHAGELAIRPVPFQELVYVQDRDAYMTEAEVPAGAKVLRLSGTEMRERLARGRELPEWFTYPEVAAELRKRHPPRARQGFTVFFTGLSGSGKSTIAQALRVRLLERGGRQVTFLDGDHVRKHLSSELTFSRAHRDLNVSRIAYVAAEVTAHGGIALCAPIAPYRATRADVRSMVEAGGGFVLVHVATSLEECERRDRKGLYAKARAGLLPQFTGISDPYETPEDAELTIDTERVSVDSAVERILAWLETEGWLQAAAAPADLAASAT